MKNRPLKKMWALFRKDGLYAGIVALILSLFSSCNAGDSITDIPQEGFPIDFSTKVEGKQTRRDALTTANLLSTGIFAYYTGNNDWTKAATPNFMYNQPVMRSNNTSPWTYSPVKYWPNNEKEKISFFAYAPYNAIGVTPSGNTVAGFPYLNYTVPTAEADQIDLLAATPLMNCTKNTGSVSLTMKHALTKVTIYVKSNDLSAGKVVNSLSVTGPKSGTLTYKAGGFDWSSSTDKGTYTATSTDVSIATSTAEETVLLGTFYLLPDRARSSLNITYTLTGSVSDNVNPPTDKQVITGLAFPDTYDWTPGTSIVYTVNIARTGLEVVAESSSMEWTNGTTKNIDFFDSKELKPGDYYYNDGSWSDGGLRMIDHSNGQIVWMDPLPDRILTNPQTNGARECIGVVFSTRMSENDKARGWTHGYVMGLSRFDAVWSPSEYQYDTPLPNITILKDMYNDLDGYDNSYAIKNSLSEEEYKLKHPLFYAVTSFAQARPVGTSEWFLPSIGQMWDLYEVLGEQMSTLVKFRTSSAQSVGVGNVNTKINPHLKNAGGNEYMTGWSYWFSSTEYSASFAVLFNSYATHNSANMQGLYKFAPDIKAPGKGFPAFAF